MKVKNKILILAIVLILGLLFVQTKTLANEEIKNNSDYEYSIMGDKVKLIKYIGKAENVVIPSEIDGLPVISIGEAFRWCYTVKSIKIPNTITSIDDSAFQSCSFESVEIPNSVTSIGNNAFSWCYSLRIVTIPNSVTTIGDFAFEGCYLDEINVSSSVTNIGKAALSGCFNINVDNNNKNYSSENGSLYNKDKTILITYSKNGEYIANSVLKIDSNAFYGNPYLTEIELPENLTSIDDFVFANVGLESITIPSKVTSIGKSAFNKNTNVNVVDDNKNYSSQDGILYNKDKSEIMHYPYNDKKNIVIPDTVTVIGDYTFDGFDKLETITLPNNLTKIGDYAFNYCFKLKIKSIPDTVTSIGDYSFRDCDSITDIALSNTLTKIGNYAFSGCDGLESIVIPESVVEIGESAFDACKKLESVTILGKITNISNKLFEYCYNLKNIVLPDSITSIGDVAFNGCYNLSQITIPNNVTNIGNMAFMGCSNLKEIIIPETVTNIGKYAFSGCTGIENIVIPSNVRKIGYHAFSNCTGLKEIVIPDGVSNIEYGTFMNCKNLKNITISSGVSKIDETAFWGIDNPTIYCCSDTLANDFAEIYKIRHAVFDKEVIVDYNKDFKYQINGEEVTILECYNQNSEKITIPEKIEGYPVTRIGEKAFGGCSKLKNITISSAITDIGENAFTNTENLTIYGYEGSTAQDYAKENNIKFQLVNSEKPSVKSYTVIFKDYDGKVLKTQTVEQGKSATAPNVPEREGYEFIGWNKSFNNVTSNLEVTAEYEIAEIKTQITEEFKIDDKTAISAILNTSDDILRKEEIEKIYKVSEWKIKNEGRLSTGDTFKVGEKEYTIVIYGDVNEDGYVNSSDALLIEKYVVKITYTDLDNVQKVAADVDSMDKEINSTDSLRIKKFKVKLDSTTVDIKK